MLHHYIIPNEPQIFNHVWKSCQDGQDDRISLSPTCHFKKASTLVFSMSTKILPTLLSKLSLETLLLLPICWRVCKMFWWKVEERQITSPQSSACTTQPSGVQICINIIQWLTLTWWKIQKWQSAPAPILHRSPYSHIQPPHPGLRILASGGRVTSSTSKEPRLGRWSPLEWNTEILKTWRFGRLDKRPRAVKESESFYWILESTSSNKQQVKTLQTMRDLKTQSSAF